jgi:hypothetical protein
MNRLRITFKWLMLIIAVIAVDLAVLPFLRGPGKRVLFGALPAVDVLAVLLATTVARLRHRGEAPLSHVMFLLAGGIALIFHVYLVQLRPDFVSEFVSMIAGRRRGGNIVVDLLRFWLAVNALILVPALFVGWAAHDYRLKITT